MKPNNEVLADMREWFRRWRSRIPAKDDGESWDRLVAEIREIVPRGQEDIFINLVNRYIEMLEAQSN